MDVCSSCRRPRKEGTQFCTGCGNRFPDDRADPVGTDSGRSSGWDPRSARRLWELSEALAASYGWTPAVIDDLEVDDFEVWGRNQIGDIQAIICNKNRVPNAPNAWKDFLDAKWKGAFSLDDTRYEWFYALQKYTVPRKRTG